MKNTIVKQCVGILCLLFSGVGIVRAAENPDDPATELASFQVADGFEVSLFASEKEGVIKPIQIRFDARGRLWVIQSTVYPQIEPGQRPNDKVLILEDTNRDGRSDSTKVFADGLMIPTGLEWTTDGIYIGQGTELLFFKDANQDDVPEEKRVVLRGFGTGDNHQNINSFLFGPGGELWMCQGLHAHSNVETPWGIKRLDQAGLWRLRPRILKLEGFYGSAHEPQNPWGYVFTQWGEPIVLAGNNSSSIYPVPGLVENHRTEAPALIWKNGQGRKSSGGDIVGTTHFPDAWQGLLLDGGYINNTVWALRIQNDGAGFSLEDSTPLLKSTSRSFRPVDVKFGPDGALYICDWYNPIIGHYQASFRHPERDKAHGRIWRVTAKGRPLTAPPQLESASVEQLITHLSSNDRWTRQFAKRVLAGRPTDDVVSALEKAAAKDGVSELALKEMLGVYQSHERLASQFLGRLSRAEDPGARAYAASVAGLWSDRLNDPLPLLRRLVTDSNPRVRLQAIVACAAIPQVEAMETALMAAEYPVDKFIQYALNQAVFSLKAQWLPALQQRRSNLILSPARLAMLVRCDGTMDTLEVLRKVLAQPDLNPHERLLFQQALLSLGTAEDLSQLLQQPDPALLKRLMPELVSTARLRQLRPRQDPTDLVRRWMQNPDSDMAADAMRLAGIWRLAGLREDLRRSTTNRFKVDFSRAAAIEGLGAFPDPQDLELFRELARTGPDPVRVAGMKVLLARDLGEGARAAAELLATTTKPESMSPVFGAFLQRSGGAVALSQALATRPPTPEAAREGLQIMNASGRREEALARVLSERAGLLNQAHLLSAKDMDALVAAVKKEGDPVRGEAIFRRADLGCLACHALRGQGASLGPDLSTLGSAQPIDFIVGAILDPQKEVKEGYISLAVTLKNGEEFQGFVLRETAQELVLRDPLAKEEIRLRRDAIASRQPIGSIMPSGLADALSREELRDLVRFLSDQGRVK